MQSAICSCLLLCMIPCKLCDMSTNWPILSLPLFDSVSLFDWPKKKKKEKEMQQNDLMKYISLSRTPFLSVIM